MLCVQTAAAQVQAELEGAAATASAGLFLRRFCLAHPLSDDSLAHHRAKYWLAELLEEPFVIGSDPPTLIDPLDVASRIMEQRVRLAEEWIEALEELPAALLELQRAHLTDHGMPE